MCFQFLYSRCDSFSNTLFSLALPPSNPSQSKINFLSTPSFSSKNLCKITSRYVFLNIVSIFVLDYADFSLGFWNLRIFEEGVGVLIFVQIFSKFSLGWVPFAVFVSVLATWGILIMFWGRFHHVHALFIDVSALVHVRCLSKCPSDIFELFGLKWVPMFGSTLDWPW